MTRIIVPMALCAALALAVVGHAAADEEQRLPGLGDGQRLRSRREPGGRPRGRSGRRERRDIFARFTLQWYSQAQGAWLPVEGAPSSPWLEVGSARQTSQQAGYTFQLDQPADGRTKQVRALAEVQWREGARSSARARS